MKSEKTLNAVKQNFDSTACFNGFECKRAEVAKVDAHPLELAQGPLDTQSFFKLQYCQTVYAIGIFGVWQKFSDFTC